MNVWTVSIKSYPENLLIKMEKCFHFLSDWCYVGTDLIVSERSRDKQIQRDDEYFDGDNDNDAS